MPQWEKDCPGPQLAEDVDPLVEALVRAHDNELLEEALDESFPASDPVSANRFD